MLKIVTMGPWGCRPLLARPLAQQTVHVVWACCTKCVHVVWACCTKCIITLQTFHRKQLVTDNRSISHIDRHVLV
jgi:hypothetical protein